MANLNTRRRRRMLRPREIRRREAEAVAEEEKQRAEKQHLRAVYRVYEEQLEAARRLHCPSCPWNLVCLTQRLPEDLEQCVSCNSVYSPSLNVYVECSDVTMRATEDTRVNLMLMSCGKCRDDAVWLKLVTRVPGFHLDKPGDLGLAVLMKRYSER